MSNFSSSEARLLPLRQPIDDHRVCPGNPFVEFQKGEIEQSIPARFEQQVSRYPQRIAVKTKHHQLTYQALNQAANQVARAILLRRGERGEPIALLLEKDAQLIATILGVLKAGKFYVPVDPDYPFPRISHMLDDSQAGLIVTNNQHLPLARELAQHSCQLINTDELDSSLPAENLDLPIPPDSFAYIIYTSGSTGQPKGLVQNHRNVLHNIRNYTNNFHICSEDRLTMLHSISFTAGVTDTFNPLLNGASLHMLDVKEEGLAELARWLRQEEITIYHSPATLFRHFVSSLTGSDGFPKLRLLNLGSEHVTSRDLELYKNHFHQGCIFVNRLGCGEALLYRIFLADRQSQISGQDVPVGYPVEDKEVHLLDEAGAEVGPNEVGEIFVKSRYLSPGYWRRPELTRAAFLPDPGGGEQRTYRTGDLGRLLPDGCLEYLGRKDFQVKIRGHRIEIAEVETALLSLAVVKETVVVAREDRPGEQRLVAYLVPQSRPAPTATVLRRALAEKLPDYMIPSPFVMLDRLPLLPGGKVDRRALPAPDQARPELEARFEAPRTPVEEVLTAIWCEVLGLERVGIHDNFFELGGHSLLAIRLLLRVQNAFGKQLSLATLFQAPTVEQLAQALRQQGWSANWKSLVALRPGGSKRPFFCVPGDLGNVFTDLGHLARYLGPDQPFYGLQDGTDGPIQIEAMAAHYVSEIRSVQPEGPYLLGGVCRGGVVAFEMAQQLRAQGEQVALLALIEPTQPPTPGPRSYLLFARSISRRVSQRFGHHLRDFLQLGSAEQQAYLCLKAKLVANRWAVRRYYPQTYPDRITLFLASGSLARSPEDPRLGWREFAQGGVELQVIPGTHNTITGNDDTKIEEAHMHVLAEKLRACIDQVQVILTLTLSSVLLQCFSVVSS